MNNFQKLKCIVLASCIATQLIATHDGHSYKNETDSQMRIEGINKRTGDLYFSDLIESNETVGFANNPGAFPYISLLAKQPNGKDVLAISDELPNENTNVILKKDAKGKYYFNFPKN